MNDQNQNRQQLIREWVDHDLAKKLAELVVRHMKKQGKENQVGVQIATLTLTLVAAVSSLEVPLQVKSNIIADIMRFTQDLATYGWDRDEGAKRKRPN